MTSSRSVLLSICVAALVIGCSKTQTPAAVGESAAVASSRPPPSTASSPPPRITLEAWKTRITSTYTEDKVKDEGQGMTSFMACFETAGPKCSVLLFGDRDAFRKLRFFTPFYTKIPTSAVGPYFVGSYVSLADCRMPKILLRTDYFSKGGWLFLNKTSFLVDGDLAMELTPAGEVSRDSESYGVSEQFTVIASDSQVDALRKVASSNNVLVRLTGDKGYVSVPKTAIANIQKDAKLTLEAFDRLTTSLQSSSAPCE